MVGLGEKSFGLSKVKEKKMHKWFRLQVKKENSAQVISYFGFQKKNTQAFQPTKLHKKNAQTSLCIFGQEEKMRETLLLLGEQKGQNEISPKLPTFPKTYHKNRLLPQSTKPSMFMDKMPLKSFQTSSLNPCLMSHYHSKSLGFHSLS